MTRMHRWAFVAPLFLTLLVSACASSGPESISGPTQEERRELDRLLTHLPDVDREFRAVWVATVANIDWPSQPALPVHKQQSELIEIMDRVRLLGMNAIILQIRPTADAFYASELEPWSYYLSGENGLAPEPMYDPLTFAVEEAQRRGLDLHVWLNPYRAGHPTATDSVAANNVLNQFPDAVHDYGTQRWMDPGAPEIADHSFRVIMDVVERYDIDGVHMDDYFYPYAVQDSDGNTVAFPDSASYAQYGEGLELADWRRQNVDRFIERVYNGIKERKPWVLFGLSPFGIWRPGHPEGVTGFDQYEGLYADARKWLRNGWVDYYTPQLYWSLDSAGQPYGTLLDWWVGENARNRHIWPGNAIYRADPGPNKVWPAEEVLNQIVRTRATSGASGNVFFSMQALRPDDQVLPDSLLMTVYDQEAIPPNTTWLGGNAPGQPTVEARSLAGRPHVAIAPGDNEPVRRWAIQILRDRRWTTRTLPASIRTIGPELLGGADAVAVRAVSRLGWISEPSMVLIR